MKLLITVNWNRKALDKMAAEFPMLEFVTATADEAMVREAADAEIVFGRITREAFLAAKQLKWIQCQGAGVETMAEIPEIAESGVVVTNTRGAHAKTIAEHAFGMLIASARGFRSLFKAQEARVWKRPLDAPMVGLSGLTMGVIGLGNIGRAIARRASGFEMSVIAVDAEDVPCPEHVTRLRRLDGLADLLSEADVVVVSTPYTPVTARMLDGEKLSLMKPSAYLIVVSRGGIVDEEALAHLLREGKLAGAGVDVTEEEPLPASSPLWDAPNLILTPHCSGQSRQTTETALRILRENLAHYLAGEPLDNLVDMRRGY